MTRWAAFAVLLLLAACTSDRNEQAADTLRALPAPPADTPVAVPGRRALQISTQGGKPGTNVTLSRSGLVLHAKVDVGFGGFAEHEILFHDTATVDGDFKATVAIPAGTRPGTYYFFLADSDTGVPFSAPVPFVVTAPDGTVTVSGRMSEGGVECPAMKSVSNEVYTLAGARDVPPVGTDVVVQGTIAEVSTCQQGITIAVTSIRPSK